MGSAMMAITMLRERQMAEAFERAGATSPEHARSLDEIGISMHGIGWGRLTRRAIVRESSPGLYYLDLPSWVATRKMRRQRSIILLILVLLVAAYLTFTGGRH